MASHVQNENTEQAMDVTSLNIKLHKSDPNLTTLLVTGHVHS